MEEVGWGDDVGCRDNGLVGCTLLGVDLRFEFHTMGEGGVTQWVRGRDHSGSTGQRSPRTQVINA